jgi:class 3 adenylate cyclase/cytoskeletal protein RodZ
MCAELEAGMQNNLSPGEEQQPHLERRLATILMADVAGYSRMMGKNEERTVQMLRGHRQVFDALLAAHHGRIFNTAGDAILAEFPSAVEAVRCATEIQSALRTRNEHFPEEERMWFRIGINLGDVIVQDTDLLGDGVNVAARIQTVADPGGVCISGSVYDQIQNKLTLQFKLLGERSFKNIAQPIRTFSISEADGAALPATPSPPRTAKGVKKIFAAVAGLCILIAVAGLTFWLYRDHQARRAEELRQAIEVERQAAESQRQAAEAEKTRVEQERQAAEEALRREHEARLATEAQAAKEALARAEIEKKRLDLKLKRAEMAAGKTADETVPPAPAATETAAPAKNGDSAGRFDGSYQGRLCNDRSATQPEKCWPVQLQVEHGEISGSWTRRVGNQGHARGSIFPDGEVALTLDGWQPDGRPTTAGLTGTCRDKTISASGRWRGGLAVSGEWQRTD